MAVELGTFPKGIKLEPDYEGLSDKITEINEEGRAFEFLTPGKYPLETPTDAAGELTVGSDGNATYQPVGFSKHASPESVIDDSNKGF
ncbi:MAG TPA: hypothetical protein VKC89_02475 [Patescibacteria group bacterium]|nr:hypothetical protein [Patescibacteria group bacterium]